MADRKPVLKPKPDRRRHPRVPVESSPYDRAFERVRGDEPRRRRQRAAEIEPEFESEPQASAVFEHAVC